MTIELSVLKAFCDNREVHNKHHVYLQSVENLERELKLLFELVKQYYDSYPADSINGNELMEFFDLRYPSSRDAELYYGIIHNAFDVTVEPELIQDILDQLIEKHHATTVVNKLLPVMEGTKYGVLHDIKSDIDNYVSLLHHPPEEMFVPEPCTLTLEELVAQEILDEGIPWHLTPLTSLIGGARSKTLGFIYAFVDAGKTSFSFGAMAAQARLYAGTDNLICYAGNEESASRLRLRFIQAQTNKTKAQIMSNIVEIEKEAVGKGLNNVRIFDEITTEAQLLYVLDEYDPSILYIDDATNMEVTFKREMKSTSYLEALFRWYRRLANRYDCAIIGVSQGVGDAENKKWLKLSDIYGSRVAIQRALDYGIGIGRKVEDPTKDTQRYIHVPKNKLHDGAGGKFVVNFTKEICLWEVI
jgi:hypothetical protein